MTQITKEAIEAFALAFWPVNAVSKMESCEGDIAKALEAALPFISSPGKDGGQEVEAVAWSERENAFTDFWEQCPKLVDASDVGKARQAFMAGMDAASFFDGPATNAAIDAVANFLKERDEAVLPDEIDDDEREASARCILRVIGKASSQPASTALVERLTKALEPFAKRAARWDDIPGIYRCHDNVELWQNGNWRCDLTVGDLREARSAIAAAKGEITDANS